MSHRPSTALAAAAAALAFSACGGGDAADGIACTTEVRPSVVLTVVDSNAVAIPSVTVTYRIGSGAWQSLVCPATGSCPVGSEQVGRFSLSVSKAGYLTGTADVQVNRGVCRVTTEQVRMVLRPTS